MNKRQFMSKLKKELNEMFNPEIEVEVNQNEDGMITVGFWRKNELLDCYTILFQILKYNEEYLWKEIGIVYFTYKGYLLGRMTEQRIIIDKLTTVLKEYYDCNEAKKLRIIRDKLTTKLKEYYKGAYKEAKE